MNYILNLQNVSENFRQNISKNIVKLKLEQNIESPLYNHLVYIYVTYIRRGNRFLTILWYKPTRWDWKTHFDTVYIKGHNCVSFIYCDFNPYLEITRLIHEGKVRYGLSWKNTNHAICWEKYLAFFH